jgi:hypothetical protein
MKAGVVLDAVRRLLSDKASTRWSDPNLLTWLNMGQRSIASVIASAASKRATISAVAGIEQAIPADGVRLLSVLHNINPDGTPGRVVTPVSRSELNDIRVAWPGAGAAAAARHILFDDDQPKIFEVWPPLIAGAKLRIVYAALPVDCADREAELGIDAIYDGALTDYVCFRCYMEDSEDPADGQKAANHLAAYQQALGVKAETDQTAVPKRK